MIFLMKSVHNYELDDDDDVDDCDIAFCGYSM